MSGPMTPKPMLLCGIATSGPNAGFPVPVAVTSTGAIITSAASAGSAGLFSAGSLITYASASGVTNDVDPTGWLTTPNSVGRINVTLGGGDAEWTGLDAAGINDGTGVLITNIDPANTLQLDNENAGSAAANRFSASGNIVLVPGQGTIAVYYGVLQKWFIR